MIDGDQKCICQNTDFRLFLNIAGSDGTGRRSHNKLCVCGGVGGGALNVKAL